MNNYLVFIEGFFLSCLYLTSKLAQMMILLAYVPIVCQVIFYECFNLTYIFIAYKLLCE